jgi:adenine-specific DNA methylase
VNRYTGPPATLGSTAAAQARLIVWCRDCRHEVEPDPAEMVERYGADLAVRAWVKRLKCSQCGSRSVDFVLTGARR